jgi:MFS family permease
VAGIERQAQTVRAAHDRPRLLPDLGALRFREYRLLWSGVLVMSTLMPLQFITGLLFLQHAAPADLRLLLAGVLGAMRGGAMLSVGLVGGVLADRFDRRRLLLATQSVALAANAGVAVLLLADVRSAAGFTGFFALSFIASGAMAVDTPTRQALVPRLVPRERLVNAVALDAMAMQVATPLSMLAAGLLIDGLGFGGAYACGLVGHVAALTALLRMRYRGEMPVSRATSPSFLRTLTEGISYARRSPSVLWLVLLLFVVMGLAYPSVGSLGPVWVTRVLGLSPAQFGLFAMAWGVGAMVASLAMTAVGHFPRKGWLVVGGAVGFAALVVVWGYSRSVPLSALVNFGLGALNSVTLISARTLVQRTVPNAVQGRVMSLFMLNMGLSQLMAAPVGALAQVFTFEVVVPVLGWLSLTLVLAIVIGRAEVRRAGLATAAAE